MKGYCTINSDASVDISKGVGGYAIWIRTDHTCIKLADRFKGKVNDSNMAEIMAVINAIYVVLMRKISVDVLVINTDNKMCRDIINRRRKNVPDKFTEVFNTLNELCRHFKICYAKHIKGHTKLDTARHHVNRWCDEYANKGRHGDSFWEVKEY